MHGQAPLRLTLFWTPGSFGLSASPAHPPAARPPEQARARESPTGPESERVGGTNGVREREKN